MKPPRLWRQPGSVEALLGWTCDDNCQYSCMWSTELDRRRGGNEPVSPCHVVKPQRHHRVTTSPSTPVLCEQTKYHGKWPFIRVFGIQELASTVFSLGNLLPHAQYLLFRRHAFAPSGLRHRWLLLTFATVGVLTWTFSAAFHARDMWVRRPLLDPSSCPCRQTGAVVARLCTVDGAAGLPLRCRAAGDVPAAGPAPVYAAGPSTHGCRGGRCRCRVRPAGGARCVP